MKLKRKLILRKEHWEPKREETKLRWRKLYDEEFHKFSFLWYYYGDISDMDETYSTTGLYEILCTNSVRMPEGKWSLAKSSGEMLILTITYQEDSQDVYWMQVE